MKYLKLLLVWLLLPAGLAVAQPAQPRPASPAATVEVSRVYSLVRFVQAAAGNGYRGNRRAFEASRFNTPAAQRWLRRYRQLDIEVSCPRQNYPDGRIGSQASSEPAYLSAAADATDLADLQRRTVGLLPNEVLASLDTIYHQLQPAFDTLAWQPHAAELARQRTAYAYFLAEKGLMARFGQLRTFYGSVWPDAVPFRILLSPQFDVGATFTNQATTLGNLVLVGTHPTSRKFAEATSVVFHEMSHALSAQQRLGLQQQLEQWYLRDAKPPYRDAYHLMEEALATVAGEWLYAQQVGQPEAGEWYQDSYIDRYAHALYPLMTGYIARGQQIDQAFVQEAGALFARTFPTAATDYTNLFRYVLYWTDSDDAGQVKQAFRDRFRSNYTQLITPVMKQDRALELLKSGDYLPVVVVTRNHEATLRYLRQQVPALQKFKLRPAQSFVLSTTGPGGSLILVNAHNPAEVVAAAQLLEKQGHFDPAQPLVLLSPAAKK
jgi:phosphoglycolate phosphatase-like HAD superfamily hydrolase